MTIYFTLSHLGRTHFCYKRSAARSLSVVFPTPEGTVGIVTAQNHRAAQARGSPRYADEGPCPTLPLILWGFLDLDQDWMVSFLQRGPGHLLSLFYTFRYLLIINAIVPHSLESYSIVESFFIFTQNISYFSIYWFKDSGTFKIYLNW